MHCSISGQGPILVMIHGWSMHSGVWHVLVDRLSAHFTLHLIDLPGHGLSDWRSGDFELETMLGWMAAELPEQACFLGWSLGGLISLAFTERYPERVEKLVLLAATPCFTQRDNWLNAMLPTVFQNFEKQLKQDQPETLKQFLLLQARGSSQSKQTIKALAGMVAEVGEVNSEALVTGLSLLMHLDMRAALSAVTCPSLLLLGERDTLIPAAMAEDARALNVTFATQVITGAGHAPFISHVDECEQAIINFVLHGQDCV